MPNPDQLLSHETLKEEAAAVVESAGVKQADLARSLDVSQGAISHALRDASGRYASLQVRIIEHLTDFRLEEVDIRYRVVRK